MDIRSLPDMLEVRASHSPDKPALRSKKSGKWRALSWKEFHERAREISFGLLALGMNAGDRVCILAKTREEWMIADFGITGAGGVTVPIYPSNLAEQCAYIINDSGARFIFADDSQQLKKLQSVRNKTPELEKAILFDGVGVNDWAISLNDLIQGGRGAAAEFEEEYRKRRTAQEKETPATIIYTSGTTGEPRGAVLPNRAFTIGCPNALKSLPLGHEDEMILFLPLAHSFAKMLAVSCVFMGITISFAESVERAIGNIKEINPTFFGSVPRVFEKIHQKIINQSENLSPVQKRAFKWAFQIGYARSRLLEARKPVPPHIELAYKAAEKVVFQKARKFFGSRLKFCISGGAPLSVEVARFFHAAGIIILEGYGMTENNSISTVNRIDHYKFGSIGRPHVGIEIKLAEDGEILQRGATNMLGYYNDEQTTRETIDAEGWLYSGDIGEIDDDGFLKITDRKKDIIITAGGKNIAPQNIESLMKSSGYISQCMIYGDNRKYLVALLTLDEEAITRFARERGIKYSEYAELAQHPDIISLIDEEIAERNKKLASYETIKKFKILPRELSEAEGEITPSLKVKKKKILNKYKNLLDELYPTDDLGF